MTVNADDFVKIRQKKLNPQMLTIQGKLKMTPLDIGLAIKLAKSTGAESAHSARNLTDGRQWSVRFLCRPKLIARTLQIFRSNCI